MQNQHIESQNNPVLYDHSRFVQLREKLLDSLDQQATNDIIDTRLDALLQHMRTKFDREEQAMQGAQFSPAAAHKADHDNAYADLSKCNERWQLKRDRKGLMDFIETGLADWFVKHVNSRDYITARFLAEPRA
jgi:hemerythrin-like metal-binding protein